MGFMDKVKSAAQDAATQAKAATSQAQSKIEETQTKKKMDDVAYIRFASVYEDFQRVDDFRDAILQVKRPGRKARRPGP